MKIKSFECNDNLAQYIDSMLFDSGETIAKMTCEENGHVITVKLMIMGEVKVDFFGDWYKYPSEFPQALKNKITSNPNNWTYEEDVYVDMNNWFEYICDYVVNGKGYSDGVMMEQDLSKYSIDDLKKEMLEIANYFAEELLWNIHM